MSAPHFLEPLLEPGASTLRLVNERTGQTVAANLELAADSASRNRGLLGRAGLPADSALIIAPCNAVHTFFMRFTIDVIFVSRQGVVLKVRRNLRPWRVAIGLAAFAAVEMAAGPETAAEISPGDRLLLAKASR